MFQNLVQKITTHKSAIYGAFAFSIFSGYLLLRNQLEQKKQKGPKKTMLDTTFKELIDNNKQVKIMKVVFTESQEGSGNYRKIVIDRIQQIFPENGTGVLINCSPKKLYDSGCESFIQSFQFDDDEYADYIINFLKTELLIQDTIQKIQIISQNSQSRFAIMLCDNNCLDLKRIITFRDLYVSDRVIQNALKKLNIKQSDLYDLYPIVVHFQQDKSLQNESQKAQNIKIKEIWQNQGFKGDYKNFKYDNNKSREQNVAVVMQFLQQKVKNYQQQQIKQIKQQQNQ